MTAVHAGPDALLSINGAARWLKRYGAKSHTRFGVLAAIARGSLQVAGTNGCQTFVRESDLERFAARTRSEEAKKSEA